MIKCPACSNELSARLASSVTLDICQSGCGGVWLDKGELEKFDEDSEPVPAEILRPLANKQVVVDFNKARKCPKCPSEVLSPYYHDDQHKIEVDQCLRCGGVWFDMAELAVLRADGKAAATRTQVIDTYAAQHGGCGEAKSMSAKVAAVFRVLF